MQQKGKEDDNFLHYMYIFHSAAGQKLVKGLKCIQSIKHNLPTTTCSSCSLNISIQSFCISCWKPLKKWELCWRIWRQTSCHKYMEGKWDLRCIINEREDGKSVTWKFKRWLATRWINVMTFSEVTWRFFPPGSSSSSACSPYSLFKMTKYSSNSDMLPL